MNVEKLSKKFLFYGVSIIVLFFIWGLINILFLEESFSIPVIIGCVIGIILIITGNVVKRVKWLYKFNNKKSLIFKALRLWTNWT